MLRQNSILPVRYLERAHTNFLMDFINIEINPQHLDILLWKDAIVNIRIKIILFQCTWTEIKYNFLNLKRYIAGLAQSQVFSTTRQQDWLDPLHCFLDQLDSKYHLKRVLQHKAIFFWKRKENSSPAHLARNFTLCPRKISLKNSVHYWRTVHSMRHYI